MNERDEFEAWLKTFDAAQTNLEIRDGLYRSALTQRAWRAWQAARATQDALRKSVEWVAVSEKEPPLGVTVLLATEFDGPGDWRVKCGGLTRDRKWHVFGADWTPTYWKPLPTPPSIAIAAKEPK